MSLKPLRPTVVLLFVVASLFDVVEPPLVTVVPVLDMVVPFEVLIVDDLVVVGRRWLLTELLFVPCELIVRSLETDLVLDAASPLLFPAPPREDEVVVNTLFDPVLYLPP